MKRLSLWLLSVVPCLSAPDSLPLGVEVVTGYRSEYIQKGYRLAQDVFEAQIEAEIALSNEWVLNLGGWYAGATGDGSFSETAFFFDIAYDTPEWTAGVRTTFRDFDNALFEDGVEIQPVFVWHLHEDWDLSFSAAYDTGADGWYGAAEVEWTKPTGDSSFISVLAGTGVTSDWYRETGWHDVHARISWTYAINRHVAVTPFAGASVPLSSGEADGGIFGGVWFEVNF